MSGFQINERPNGILVYSFEDSEQNTIDDWVEQSLIIQCEYETSHRHLRLVYQCDEVKLPTPYAVRQTIRLINSRPLSLHFSSAIVVSNLNFDMVSQHIIKRVPYSNHIHPVKDFEEAIAWLDERHRKFQPGLPLEMEELI